MVTEKLALRSGSSKQGKTLRASTDCSCDAARNLKHDNSLSAHTVCLQQVFCLYASLDKHFYPLISHFEMLNTLELLKKVNLALHHYSEIFTTLQKH